VINLKSEVLSARLPKFRWLTHVGVLLIEPPVWAPWRVSHNTACAVRTL
jgi:hypothetical protein